MADTKVSALPAATTPLDGTEVLPVVQGGVSEKASVDDLRGMSTDYVDTTPATPTTGLRMFSRTRARRIPAFVGPSGLDSALQPALFSNRIMRATSAWVNATMVLDGGMPTLTANGTAAAAVTPVLTSTNLFESLNRTRFASAATANSLAGIRQTNLMWSFSDTANKGGFFIVFRAGWNAMTSGGRAFIGLNVSGGAVTLTADPSGSFLNHVGFFMDAADTTWRFLHAGGSGTRTVPATQPGANFPGKTNATDFYEFRLFAPSGSGSAGSGQRIGWSIHRLNTGHVFNGTEIVSTTALPAINTPLAFHAAGINVTASAISMDVQSLYSETDN